MKARFQLWGARRPAPEPDYTPYTWMSPLPQKNDVIDLDGKVYRVIQVRYQFERVTDSTEMVNGPLSATVVLREHHPTDILREDLA